MWYVIVFNKAGIQITKSGLFPTSQQATFWAECIVQGKDGYRYQLFQANK